MLTFLSITSFISDIKDLSVLIIIVKGIKGSNCMYVRHTPYHPSSTYKDEIIIFIMTYEGLVDE